MAIGNKVEIEITANNKGAVSGIDQVTNKLGGLGKSASGLNFGGLTSGITSMINPTMMLGTAVTGAATAFGVMIKNSMDVADQMSKDAQKIGLTTEKLSTLSYAASYADLSNEQLVASLKKLSMNMEDSIDGSSALITSLDKIGVSLASANGTMKSSDALLMDVAQAFQKMPDGITKTNAAIDIFGKQGIEMIPLLNGGADGLRLMEEEARRLGLEISTKTGRDAEMFNDTIAKMEKMFEGAAMQLAGQLLPHLQNMADKIMPALGSTIESGVGFMEDMMRAGEGLSKILDQVGGSNFWDKLMWLSTRPANWTGAVFGLFGDLVGGATVVNANLRKDADKTIKFITEKHRKLNQEADELGEERTAKNKLVTDKAIQDAKRLFAEWEKIREAMREDNRKNSMSDLEYKLDKINREASERFKKFGGLDEEGEIERWAFKQINALVLLDGVISRTAERTNSLANVNIPANDIMSSPELLAMRMKTDLEIQMMTEVTTAELANLALRDEATSAAFGNMANVAQTFYELGGQKSKEAFFAYKAISIAQAGIDTWKAAESSYAFGATIGGPILGGIYAGVAVSAGLANIAKIAAMQPGSSPGGGGSYPAPPSVSQSQLTGGVTNNDNSKRIHITVLGHIVDQDKFARELIPSLEKAYGDGNGGGS